jgi:hypothetical protein
MLTLLPHAKGRRRSDACVLHLFYRTKFHCRSQATFRLNRHSPLRSSALRVRSVEPSYESGFDPAWSGASTRDKCPEGVCSGDRSPASAGRHRHLLRRAAPAMSWRPAFAARSRRCVLFVNRYGGIPWRRPVRRSPAPHSSERSIRTTSLAASRELSAPPHATFLRDRNSAIRSSAFRMFSVEFAYDRRM